MFPKESKLLMKETETYFMFVAQDPKKRLFFFVSVPIDAVFRAFLTKLVGTDNIYTYSQYLETD